MSNLMKQIRDLQNGKHISNDVSSLVPPVESSTCATSPILVNEPPIVKVPLVESKPIKQNIIMGSKYQTAFFNKSVRYTENVLFGKSFLPQYPDSSFYATKLLDVIYKLDDGTKNSILKVVNGMGCDEDTARENEVKFRAMAEKECLPLWFVILRQATDNIVPNTQKVSDANMADILANICEKTSVSPLFKIA